MKSGRRLIVTPQYDGGIHSAKGVGLQPDEPSPERGLQTGANLRRTTPDEYQGAVGGLRVPEGHDVEPFASEPPRSVPRQSATVRPVQNFDGIVGVLGRNGIGVTLHHILARPDGQRNEQQRRDGEEDQSESLVANREFQNRTVGSGIGQRDRTT